MYSTGRAQMRLQYNSLPTIILFVMFTLGIACGDAAHILEPPPDTTTVVPRRLTGPPHHAELVPNTLTLIVGEKQSLPQVIIYDSTNTVILETDLQIGWRLESPPLYIDLTEWTVWATAPFKFPERGSILTPLAVWNPYHGNGSGTYTLGVRVTLTATEN